MSNPNAYLIIGAAGGIGAALSRLLAGRGDRLMLAGRDAARLAALASELAGIGGGGAAPPARVLDARRFDEVDAAADAAMAELGRLDGVVNLAGSIVLKAAHQTSQADLQAVIDQNLTTAFAAVRAGARVMRAGGGSVVLVSSVAARVGLANHEAIAAAKAGVLGLTMAAAATYAGSVRVNAVAPGLTRTPMAAPLLSSEVAEKASTAMHPAGRLGTPADIASAIAFLLDPANSWITGQVLGVDGGMSTARPRPRA
jgi:NAD(P)-dependent dehydrogenase (short-subunit alcohol dehydrogenase family)